MCHRPYIERRGEQAQVSWLLFCAPRECLPYLFATSLPVSLLEMYVDDKREVAYGQRVAWNLSEPAVMEAVQDALLR